MGDEEEDAGGDQLVKRGKRRKQGQGHDLGDEVESGQIQRIANDDGNEGEITDDSHSANHHTQQNPSITPLTITQPSSSNKPPTIKIPPHPSTPQESNPFFPPSISYRRLFPFWQPLRKKYTFVL